MNDFKYHDIIRDFTSDGGINIIDYFRGIQSREASKYQDMEISPTITKVLVYVNKLSYVYLLPTSARYSYTEAFGDISSSKEFELSHLICASHLLNRKVLVELIVLSLGYDLNVAMAFIACHEAQHMQYVQRYY